jgi:hypothetical protein
MKKFYQSIKAIVLIVLIIGFSITLNAQNLGFEATPAATPPSNWTAVTGTWTINTTTIRTGSQSMTITDPATTGTTMGTVSPVLTTTSPGYLITMAWGRSNVASNAVIYLGYRTGTTNTLNPSAATTGQPANLNNTAWTRVTSVSASGTIAAGSYGVSMRAFRTAGTAGTTLYLDDIIIYASTSNVPDLTAPNTATNGLVAGQNISWSNGTDNGTPASGIGGVVIIRADGAGQTAPALNDQAMYNPTNGAAGTSSFTDNSVPWTVVANITGNSTQNFTDATAGGGPYTYVIYMRDMAYNYSIGHATSSVTGPCTFPPTPGTSTVNPSAIQCAGVSRTLNLTGNSFGTGQTYRWLSSSSQFGSYSYVTSSSSNPGISINPTVTTWYKAEVTCSGNSLESTPVEVLVNPAFSGTYTINSGQPTGSGNYQTFADAISALGCGINGPVVFNVQAGSGPYNVQVIIPAVTGTSATNTITFNGNGETVSYTSTNTAERAVIKLNGADYVTINNFNITATGSGTTEYGYGVQLVDDADNNKIQNCTITTTSTPATAASTAYAGIVVNASTATTAVATGNSLCDNNIISGNTITGGYVGIAIMANGITNTVAGNQLLNNTVQDVYTFGIKIGGNTSAIIEGNNVSRPVRSSVTTLYAIDLDGYSINTKVSKNKLHDPYGGSSANTNAAYGVRLNACDATSGNSNIISNNMVYSFVGATGTQNGFLNNSSDYASYYYNSVLLDDAGASCACAARGFYVQTTTVAGLDFRNNTVSIGRGGTGDKQGIYFEPTSVSSYTIDNNNYYLFAAAGLQEIAHVGTTGYAGLAAWQSGSSKETNSQNTDPLFLSATDLHLQPASLISTLGTPIAGITTDIDGNTRSSVSPAIGADELPPVVGIDMRPGALISPAVSANGCYDVQTITVSINNNSTTAIDFSVNPVTISVNVTGAATGSYSATVNTGTLSSGASMNVTMATPGSTLNMSAIGTYAFNMTTNVAGDVNSSNNSITVNRDKATLFAGTIAPSATSYCASGSPQLTSTGPTGYSSLQWQSSTTSGSGFGNISGGTTNPFTVPAITQTTYFKLIATCGTSTDISSEIDVTVNNPQITGTTPGTRCGPGTVDLSATTSGSGLNWYAAASGGSSIGTGSPFTTPTLSSTTTYYVAANDGGSQMNVASPTIGSSVFITTTVGWGLRFTISNTPVTINTVTVRAQGSSAGPASIQIKVTDLSDVVLYTGVLHNFTVGTALADYIIPVNITVPPGNYKMGMTYTGLSNMVRESSGVTFPYISPGGDISITAGANGAGTAQTTTAYYWFYNWVVATGCEGTRTPVIATVNTAPSLTVTASKTICNNATHTLSVTSTISDFNSYIWSPQTDLYTDAGATIPYTGNSATTVYVKTTTSAAVTYTLSALNNTTQCTGVVTTTVTTMPDPVINSSVPDICTSGSAILSLNPSSTYGANAGFQWQNSPNGTVYNDISGATNSTYTTPTITQTTYYKLILKDQAGATCSQPTINVVVNTPQLTGTTPASRCGVGTVDLGATGGVGTTLNWYAAASGGTPLGTGNTFTTPSIGSTTNYYVAASSGGSTANVGLPAAITTTQTGVGTTNFGLVFDVFSAFTLQTVTIYPVSATGASGTVTIDVINGSGTIVHQAIVNVTGAPVASMVPQTVTLNFNIQPGTNYKLRPGSFTGISSLVFEPAAAAPGGNYGYPFTVPGVVSINTSTLAAAPTNTPNNALYYYFYNWQIATGCEGPRTAVTAGVNTPPALTITSGKTICNEATQMLQVTSTIGDFNSYVWSPQTDLYTNASATIPYTGGNATAVYVKSSAAASTTYTLTANNSTTQCANTATSVIITMPASSIISTKPEICVSGATTLSLSPATGYGAASFQWQSSLNGTTYGDIGGATSSSYTTPTLSSTTYYKIILKDGSGTTCSEPTFIMTVNNPQVTGTTPASRCGTGTVTLGATASAGSTLNWYAAASGGSSISSGTTFTTPSINSNTTYYVSASIGAGGNSAVGPVSPSSIGSPTSSTIVIGTQGTFFDVLATNATIASIDVFPTAVIGSSFSIVVQNSSGTQIFTSGTLTTTVTGGALQTVNLNATIPQGTGYKIGLGVNPGMNRVTTGAVYPYTIPGILSITGNTFDPVYFYFTYNWQVVTGCESSRSPVIATVNPTASNAAGSIGITECGSATIAGATDINYTDCDLITTINPSGGSPITGSVNACVRIDATVQTAPGGEAYVQRHFDITPASNPTIATSTITLYFLQSEFNAFNTARGTYPALPTNSSDATGKANLRITHYRGTGTAPGNYTGTTAYIDPLDFNIVWNNTDSRWEITFGATGGGGFYVHTGNFVLPVAFTDFRGEKAGAINKLLWTTQTEANNSGFELQRSADGQRFSKLAFIATKADNGYSNSALNYIFNDENTFKGNNYYRLKQIDKDGRFKYSTVVLLRSKATEITLSSVYPNPAQNELNLVITSPSSEKVTIVVTDLSGKVIMQQTAQLVIGDNQQQLKVQSLASGTYIIKAVCSSGCKTAVHRFVKQ